VESRVKTFARQRGTHASLKGGRDDHRVQPQKPEDHRVGVAKGNGWEVRQKTPAGRRKGKKPFEKKPPGPERREGMNPHLLLESRREVSIKKDDQCSLPGQYIQVKKSSVSRMMRGARPGGHTGRGPLENDPKKGGVFGGGGKAGDATKRMAQSQNN